LSKGAKSDDAKWQKITRKIVKKSPYHLVFLHPNFYRSCSQNNCSINTFFAPIYLAVPKHKLPNGKLISFDIFSRSYELYKLIKAILAW